MDSKATRYQFLRSMGASHDAALLKVVRGNWNPYDGPAPEVTPEQLQAAENDLITAGVFVR